MNFFDLLAVAVWIGVIASGVLLLRGLRQSRPAGLGPAPRLHDLSEAAFMAGGPGAVVDAALVSLLCDGRMLVGGPGIVQVRPGVRGGDPAQRAVLQACQGAPSGWLYQIRYAAMRDPAVQETGDALAARGLITSPGARQRRLRVHGAAQAVVCGVLLVLSLPLTVADFVLHEGNGVPFVAEVLPVLLAGIAVGSVAASRARRRITPAGAEALRAVRAQYGADQSPYVQTSLFGLRGLRDPYLREQLVPAARGTRLAAAQSRTRSGGSGSAAEVIPVLWCAGSDGGGGGGAGCGSSGSSCGAGGGGGCGGGGGGGSSCSGSSGGSSCSSSSSGSSCSSSSSSSCGSSS